MRRDFLKYCGLMGLGFATPFRLSVSARADQPPKTRRVTLAQILVGRVVAENLKRMTAAIEQAMNDKAGWVFFPEATLSGYYGGFKQEEVEEAFTELCRLCKGAGLNGIIGTCWNEDAGKPHNQIRIVDRRGELVGRYAKTCLTYSDVREFTAGGFPLVHKVEDLMIGTLICNDLWVTPGFTDGPNPHLTLKQARAGAQVIFHAVSSGGDQKYRAYHESNQALRAAEAKCPIVTVNSAVAQGEVNCASGVVLPSMEYASALPRKGEHIETVEFTPRGT
jgi:predicted amidohydrolase